MSQRKRIERIKVHERSGNVYKDLAPTPMRLKKRGKGVVAVPEAELPTLTAEVVRDTLERVRR